MISRQFFVTVNFRDGHKAHHGPFKTRQEGIDWAKERMSKDNRVAGWENGILQPPYQFHQQVASK